VARLKPNRWFLPQTPDFLGMLGAQVAVTREGMAAFVEWARGDEQQGAVVREAEHAADDRKRDIWHGLQQALTSPLDPEDLFELSKGLDSVLTGAKDTVREAEVMGMAPDEPMAEMAVFLLEGVNRLAEAFERLGSSAERATEAADEAVRCARKLERVYRQGMSALLQLDDLAEVFGRRELYRRLSRLGDQLAGVAERIWYATVKEA
jgi:uncharacterized protein Yka (UPF0111/DUF47 family)